MDIQQAEITVEERGKDGAMLDRRLFIQLLAFGNCHDTDAVIAELAKADFQGTLYADINDPYGIAVVACAESADYFVSTWRNLLSTPTFAALTPKPKYTMFGRTYTIGYEADLESALLHKPIEKVTDNSKPWAIWYPLRRKGDYEGLSADEKRTILMEHGGIGRAYGRAGLGTDIRLASFGLDQDDNDFVIGVLGKELTPLSKIIERMRKTKQTSQYLASLGPFFIGKAIYQKK